MIKKKIRINDKFYNTYQSKNISIVLTSCDWPAILVPLHFHRWITYRGQLRFKMSVTAFL